MQCRQHVMACPSFTDKDPETPCQASEPAPPAALACHRSCPGASGLTEEPAAAASPAAHSRGLRQWHLHGGRGWAAAFWDLVFVGGFTPEEVLFLNEKCGFMLGGQSERISPSPEDLQRQPGQSLSVSAPGYALVQCNWTRQSH